MKPLRRRPHEGCRHHSRPHKSRRPHSSTRRSSRSSFPPGGMHHVSSARRSPAARSTTSRCPAALLSALRWPTARSTSRRTALRSPASSSTTSRGPAAPSSAIRWPTARSTARRSPAARSTTPLARPLRWASQRTPRFVYEKVVSSVSALSTVSRGGHAARSSARERQHHLRTSTTPSSRSSFTRRRGRLPRDSPPQRLQHGRLHQGRRYHVRLHQRSGSTFACAKVAGSTI